MPKHTKRPSLFESYFNPDVELPYGLTVAEVKAAINAAYDLLHDVNTFMVGRGHNRLEDLLLGNAFAGLLSEVLVKSLADHSPALVRNTYVGGHPDLTRSLSQRCRLESGQRDRGQVIEAKGWLAGTQP